MEIIIHDKRPEKEFNTTTFSNFKKSEVIKAFIESINSNSIESALSWNVELLCSGRLKDIWDAFLLTMGKHIRCGNPKIALYLVSRFEKFKKIIGIGYGDLEIEVRNNSDMRNLMAEITMVLTLSPKKPPLQMLKVKKGEDYSLEKLGTYLKADSMTWCEPFLRDEDPKEILLAVNEFVYHFSKKNLLKCCFWIDWIIDFDTLCRKQKKPITICDRDFITVDAKSMGDPIWIFWEVLKRETTHKDIINALLELFCIRYNFSQKKKRRHLLYLAIEIYTETVDMSVPIIHHMDKIKTVMPQINKFYKLIKKHEQRPEVISDKQRNLMKSIDKMKMLYDFI